MMTAKQYKILRDGVHARFARDSRAATMEVDSLITQLKSLREDLGYRCLLYIQGTSGRRWTPCPSPIDDTTGVRFHSAEPTPLDRFFAADGRTDCDAIRAEDMEDFTCYFNARTTR